MAKHHCEDDNVYRMRRNGMVVDGNRREGASNNQWRHYFLYRQPISNLILLLMNMNVALTISNWWLRCCLLVFRSENNCSWQSPLKFLFLSCGISVLLYTWWQGPLSRSSSFMVTQHWRHSFCIHVCCELIGKQNPIDFLFCLLSNLVVRI